MLTELKRQPDTRWLQECSNVVLQQSLGNLDAAFKNFFQGRAKYPSFKKKHDKQSARYTTSGFRWKNGEIWLAKMDAPLNIRCSRAFVGEASSINVSKDAAGRYFISILVEEAVQTLAVVNKMAGLDMGLSHAVIAQRAMAKRQKGSKNHVRARQKVARLHAKVKDRREDFLHKTTRRLVNENQVLAAETLQVKNMVRNHSLAKAIQDVGWGERRVNWPTRRSGAGGLSFRGPFKCPCRCPSDNGRAIVGQSTMLRIQEKTTVGHTGGQICGA